MSSTSILKAEEYLESLNTKYPGIEVPFYKFREWYSTKERFFFDCKENSLKTCLKNRIEFESFSYFRVFFIVKKRDTYMIKDIIYPNIAERNLKSWVLGYEKNLKSSTIMSINASGVYFVDELGYSYNE